MDEIKNGNFPEPRSRQEMYLQDIIGELSKDSSVSEKAYPEPRSRQESYLQIIIGKIKEISNSEDSKCKCDVRYTLSMRPQAKSILEKLK